MATVYTKVTEVYFFSGGNLSRDTHVTLITSLRFKYGSRRQPYTVYGQVIKSRLFHDNSNYHTIKHQQLNANMPRDWNKV